MEFSGYEETTREEEEEEEEEANSQNSMLSILCFEKENELHFISIIKQEIEELLSLRRR